MATDSPTAPAPALDAPGDRDGPGPGWREQARSGVYWSVAHGRPLAWLLDRTAPRVQNPVEPPSLLATEPPDHTRYRRLATRVFTVRAVERLRVRTEAIAHELLDGLAPSAPVDLIESYCAQLPLTVITEILGVPPAQRNRVLELGTRAASTIGFTPVCCGAPGSG
jgi:cytochrome P450